ncbi:MAG: hypothetical protein GY847_33985, partial [Proteobacteria bacterium]|nr:hypothetical protein [Pseudomonadota bacterium]
MSFNTDDTARMTMADPTQIEQVLLNLCVNAGHAMTIMRKTDKAPGGKLTVEITEIISDTYFCEKHPEAEPGLYYWRVSVQDTGVGMDVQTLSRIFDPFFTTKEKGKGTGLGLAMVYNIVKHHRGLIDVYSEEKLGSTFNVYMPVLQREEAVDELSRQESL